MPVRSSSGRRTGMMCAPAQETLRDANSGFTLKNLVSCELNSAAATQRIQTRLVFPLHPLPN